MNIFGSSDMLGRCRVDERVRARGGRPRTRGNIYDLDGARRAKDDADENRVSINEAQRLATPITSVRPSNEREIRGKARRY